VCGNLVSCQVGLLSRLRLSLARLVFELCILLLLNEIHALGCVLLFLRTHDACLEGILEWIYTLTFHIIYGLFGSIVVS
jgi:hypothetical protein